MQEAVPPVPEPRRALRTTPSEGQDSAKVPGEAPRRDRQGKRERGGDTGNKWGGELSIGGERNCERWKFSHVLQNTRPTRAASLAPRPYARTPARIPRRLHGRQVCGAVRRRRAHRASCLIAPPGRAPRCPPPRRGATTRRWAPRRGGAWRRRGGGGSGALVLPRRLLPVNQDQLRQSQPVAGRRLVGGGRGGGGGGEGRGGRRAEGAARSL